MTAIGGILWSHGGILALLIGVLGMWWGLTLYLAHRHAEGHFCPDPNAHRLPTTGAAAISGTGPEVLSVLRQLRSELRDSLPKLEGSIQSGKFWAAGTEGDAEGKGWRKNRDRLRGMSGMNPLWDRLEDAFGRLTGADKLRADRVFKGYRLQPGDAETLNAAIGATRSAIQQLESQIESLDTDSSVARAPITTGHSRDEPSGLVEQLKDLRAFADVIRPRIPMFGQSPVPKDVETDLDDWIGRVSAVLESKPELKRQFDTAGDNNQLLAALNASPASQRLQNRTSILDEIIKYLDKTTTSPRTDSETRP